MQEEDILEDIELEEEEVEQSPRYYFALETDPGKFIDSLSEKIDDYYEWTWHAGYQYLWLGVAETYYNAIKHLGNVQLHGEKGEYAVLVVNRFRTNINRQITMATKSKLEYKPVAANTDYRSQFQATLIGQNLLKYYMNEQRAERFINRATQYDALFGEGWVHLDFDRSLGDEPLTEQYPVIDDETGQETINEQIVMDEVGQAVFEGDIKISAHTPNNIIRNPFAESINDCNWFIVRERVDKHLLAEKYYGVTSEEGEDVYEMICKSSFIDQDHDFLTPMFLNFSFHDKSNMIYKYTFYHKPTPSLPFGRKFVFLRNSRIALEDTSLQNNKIPLVREAQYEGLSSPMGWSPAFDMLPLQEELDDINSTISTNQRAFGLHNIVRTPGTIRFDNISEGLNEYVVPDMADAPQVLQLLNTAPELVNRVIQLNQDMDTLAGLSDISHGSLPSSGLSGRAMFLLESRAIEANSPLQGARVAAVEDVASMIIDILLTNWTTPRLLPIAGESNAREMMELTQEDLKNINRVYVEVVNPIAATYSGRMEMAEFLLKLVASTGQPLFSPEHFLNFMSTGNLDIGIEGKVKEIQKIKKIKEIISDVPEFAPEQQQMLEQLEAQYAQIVNQAQMQGQVPPQYPYDQFYTVLGIVSPVLKTDNHILHIQELASMASGPSIPAHTYGILTKALNHHIDILTDPANAGLLMVLGQPSLAAPPQQGGGAPLQQQGGGGGGGGPAPPPPTTNMQQLEAVPKPSDFGMPQDMMRGQKQGNLDEYGYQN